MAAYWAQKRSGCEVVLPAEKGSPKHCGRLKQRRNQLHRPLHSTHKPGSSVNRLTPEPGRHLPTRPSPVGQAVQTGQKGPNAAGERCRPPGDRPRPAGAGRHPPPPGAEAPALARAVAARGPPATAGSRRSPGAASPALEHSSGSSEHRNPQTLGPWRGPGRDARPRARAGPGERGRAEETARGGGRAWGPRSGDQRAAAASGATTTTCAWTG